MGKKTSLLHFIDNKIQGKPTINCPLGVCVAVNIICFQNFNLCYNTYFISFTTEFQTYSSISRQGSFYLYSYGMWQCCMKYFKFKTQVLLRMEEKSAHCPLFLQVPLEIIYRNNVIFLTALVRHMHSSVYHLCQRSHPRPSQKRPAWRRE